MRVLHVNNFFSNYGGAENSMYKDATLVKQMGNEIYFFAVDKQPYIENKYEYARYFPDFIDYRSLSVVQSLKNMLKVFYNVEAERKLDSYIKEIKPDIVRCHNIYYHITPSVFNACNKNNVPIVMTLHDPRMLCPGGTLMFRNESYCRRMSCISGNPYNCIANRCKNGSLKASLMAASEFIFNKTFKFYDKVSIFTCPSKAIYDLACQSGIKEERLALINHFVQDSMYDIKPEYTNKGYFLYVGRLSKEKGLNYLLEAMYRLPEVNLHIVGKGPEEDYLKSMARNLDLQNVEFLGFKSGDDLSEEYRNCISTVLPCNWFEVFGLTNVESFIYGKPVIASNIGGIPEIVEDGKHGIIFEPGNVDELTEAIKKLHYNPSLVVEMGRNARDKVEREYNSKIYYEKLISVYNSVAQRSIR